MVLYNLGVGPCSFRVGGRETANQSKCENEDLMLLMSTQKDETAVQHYIFNRMCQTPYQDYFVKLNKTANISIASWNPYILLACASRPRRRRPRPARPPEAAAAPRPAEAGKQYKLAEL